MNDTEYRDHVIESVDADGLGFKMDDGWSFYCPPESPVRPRVGATARLYGRGTGYPIRGLSIDGVTAFYRTPQQEDARHEAMVAKMAQDKRDAFDNGGRAALDAKYAALPAVFQRRIDRFRKARKDWRVEYEAYEMSCCEDGVKIAAAFKTQEEIDEWRKKPYEAQMAEVPGLFDGHSGNSFGCAVYLARCYLNDPESVIEQHGALVPLVGCRDYGCEHPTPPRAKEWV